ncbi:hypothetical protein [Bradyrhizobium sp. LB11.1]|uniref:hypothetical protein n=1 Tax=Bradyrhizobium sp. LB11.1 TaxID=3156326 RepID=UPI0033997F88
MTDAELIAGLDKLKATMISVATGGPPIPGVEHSFVGLYDGVEAELRARRIDTVPPYRSLWEWHGRWSQSDLKTYQLRRTFINDIFAPIIKQVRDKPGKYYEPTGWARVDRTVAEMRTRLASAKTEEQFQAVGLLGRELLISAAQEVFDPAKHPTLDGVAASATDTKRMLEAYIAVALGGGVNEFVRKHAKAALDLAVQLQHRRTASFRDAAICVEATTSVVNLVAIIAGLRDQL